MRILNINFKNINSLEGEGRIDFDQGPIADSGVFAITGPNGSGKTSILDVITLGLYGETFRLDKPAEHVMTKQTNDSVAQVEFALGDVKFRSSWRVERTGDSVLQPHMALARLDGEQQELLADTPNSVRTRIAELTGMDFHKFSKSMVLPQGDFAAFLNALDSERMDILEKISGSDIYRDYREQAESNYQAARAGLAQLQQDIELIPLLAPEALEAAEQDLQDFKQQADELKAQQALLEQQMRDAKNVRVLQNRQIQLESQLRQIEDQIQQLQTALQEIGGLQDAAQYREELIALDAKQVQLEQSQASLAAYRQELEMLRRQLGAEAESSTPEELAGKSLEMQKQAIDTLKLKISELKLLLPSESELVQAIDLQLAEKRAALAEVDTWLQEQSRDAALLSDFPDIPRLRNLRVELAELSGKQKSQSNWTKTTTAALQKNKSALNATKADISELEAKISDARDVMAELAQGKSFDELKDLAVEQQGRVNDFRELLSIAEVNAKFNKKGFFHWFSAGSKPADLPDAAGLQARLEELRDELSREDNIGKALEQAVANEALLKRFAAERSKLVEGQPCYLCGSLHHPYLMKPPLQSNAKKALVDQRGKMQALKTTIDTLAAQLAAAEKRGVQISARDQRLQQMRSDWQLLVNRLNVVSQDLTIDNVSLQKRLLANETEELEKIKNLVNEHAQLQRNVAKWLAEIDNKKSALEKLAASVSQLDEAWNNRPSEFVEVEQRFAGLKAEEKALTEQLEQQLEKLGEKLPGKGKENLLFDKLNARRQDYQIREMRQKGLIEEVAALQEKLRGTHANIIDYQNTLSDYASRLLNEESVGLHLALIEKQKLIVDCENALSAQQIEFEAMSRLVAGKLAGSDFADIDDLRAALMLIDSRQQIEAALADQAGLRVSIVEALTKTGEELQREAAVLTMMANTDEESILYSLKQLTRQLEIAEQEVHSLENKLDKQQGYREKLQGLQGRLSEQLALYSQAEADLKLISDEQGGLRKRIQQLLVDKLMSKANQILEKLSGRYYVRSAVNDHGLALEIEDTKQRNLRRLPKTLSGGESFVVSLALALALAEIANNGRAIDSLFLDEGFGNLDAEALYLAMSALEGLTTQGKTVGVISHVDAVKKRIKTQIELVKKANGLSELKMVA
ncbi:AAA family ATPase [Methylomonas koyamae]|uniref:AAA family ATPase n=2 Tax=Methylomonas TaxID=416 RepID=UPI00112E43C0|nr:AAA family ATPase [Methylomonas koyamae]TPQ29603.1 chromosome segregation protein SMC [Methylomonas koyamae]